MDGEKKGRRPAAVVGAPAGAGRAEGKEAGREAGREAGWEAGREAGRQAGRIGAGPGAAEGVRCYRSDTAPVFETARLQDLPALIAMLADDPLGATRERPGEPPDPCYVAAFEAIDADPNQELVVARPGPGEAPCGCLQLSFVPGLARAGAWRGQIEGVRIARDWRDRGIGRQMLAWAISRCRQRGCSLVQLTTDRSRGEARRFYESLGFVASHDGMKLALPTT